MSMAEKAKILAKLAELKNAKGPDDIIDWFHNNDWVYAMVDQMLKGMAAKYGIISCEKVVEGDTVTFIMTTENSDVIYNGVKNMIAGNASMVKKLKAKFSVDRIDNRIISVKVYTIPGKTESFMRLIDVVEKGVSEYRGEQYE